MLTTLIEYWVEACCAQHLQAEAKRESDSRDIMPFLIIPEVRERWFNRPPTRTRHFW